MNTGHHVYLSSLSGLQTIIYTRTLIPVSVIYISNSFPSPSTHPTTSPLLTTSCRLSFSFSASSILIPIIKPLTSLFIKTILLSTPLDHSLGKYCLHSGRRDGVSCEGPVPIYRPPPGMSTSGGCRNNDHDVTSMGMENKVERLRRAFERVR